VDDVLITDISTWGLSITSESLLLFSITITVNITNWSPRTYYEYGKAIEDLTEFTKFNTTTIVSTASTQGIAYHPTGVLSFTQNGVGMQLYLEDGDTVKQTLLMPRGTNESGRGLLYNWDIDAKNIYVQSQLKNVEVICFDGYCPIHNDITKEEIEEKIKLYPNAKVLVHPECRAEILAYADEVGSTTKILKYVAESSHNEFIIVTEQGVTDRLKRDYPNKTIVSISPNAICKSMKFTSLEDILACLEEEKNEVSVYNSIIESAYKPIEKMISIS
jgi:hypothetical protein